MITIWQKEAIIRLAKSLKSNPKGHPSESYRESFASYTQEQIDETVEALRQIWKSNDGWLAWKILNTEKKRCAAAVVGLYVNGQLKIK